MWAGSVGFSIFCVSGPTDSSAVALGGGSTPAFLFGRRAGTSLRGQVFAPLMACARGWAGPAETSKHPRLCECVIVPSAGIEPGFGAGRFPAGW